MAKRIPHEFVLDAISTKTITNAVDVSLCKHATIVLEHSISFSNAPHTTSTIRRMHHPRMFHFVYRNSTMRSTATNWRRRVEVELESVTDSAQLIDFTRSEIRQKRQSR